MCSCYSCKITEQIFKLSTWPSVWQYHGNQMLREWSIAESLVHVYTHHTHTSHTTRMHTSHTTHITPTHCTHHTPHASHPHTAHTTHTTHTHTAHIHTPHTSHTPHTYTHRTHITHHTHVHSMGSLWHYLNIQFLNCFPLKNYWSQCFIWLLLYTTS